MLGSKVSSSHGLPDPSRRKEPPSLPIHGGVIHFLCVAGWRNPARERVPDSG